MQAIYTNELDQGAYISQTLRIDETVDEFAARVAIYRMMRPGEPPTEDAVQALFQRLFYNPDTYDLSRVGRMKFNAKVGRDEIDRPDGADQRGHPRRGQDPGGPAQRPRRSRRHRPPGQPPRALRRRTGREPVPHRPGPHREGREGASGPGRARAADAARPDQLQADLGRAEGVLRRVAAVAVHGPDQPAVRDHAQAPRLGPRPGRSDARARRLRSARRARHPLRPRVPDRNAGRPEHRPDQLAGAVRPPERIRLHRDAVPPRGRRQGHDARSTTCRPSRKASTSSPRPTPRSTRTAA